MNRGQAISQVLMWGAGIIGTSAMAFSGYINNRVGNVEKIVTDNNTAIVQRVATTETENKQFRKDIDEIKDLLKEINGKIK